jgi:hypothetical protein
MFTQKRLQHVPDETSFLAYYNVTRSKVELVGVYPSKDLFNQGEFWF